jgi:hypothetical protein
LEDNQFFLLLARIESAEHAGKRDELVQAAARFQGLLFNFQVSSRSPIHGPPFRRADRVFPGRNGGTISRIFTWTVPIVPFIEWHVVEIVNRHGQTGNATDIEAACAGFQQTAMPAGSNHAPDILWFHYRVPFRFTDPRHRCPANPESWTALWPISAST